ncbi:hypothetical protein WT34_12190 [Burkholderia stagnalis]|nr:hypothetical protein WT28_22630 [Burkholderia stagnalis]KVX78017.1 hypothetical protein WT34_12190 [Burkholderia stagnalis]
MIRIGPTSTEVVMPLGDKVNRTPGIGLKLFLKCHSMVYPRINVFLIILHNMMRLRRLPRGDAVRQRSDFLDMENVPNLNGAI